MSDLILFCCLVARGFCIHSYLRHPCVLGAVGFPALTSVFIVLALAVFVYLFYPESSNNYTKRPRIRQFVRCLIVLVDVLPFCLGIAAIVIVIWAFWRLLRSLVITAKL